MRLVGIVADERDARPGLGEPASDEDGLTEHGRADDEHGIVWRERLPEPRPVGGEHARVERVILGEPGARSERLLEDGCDEALGEVDERRPRLGIVRTGADDERGRAGAGEEVHERVDGFRPGSRRAKHRAGGRCRLALLVRRLFPVAHGDDHERGAASCDGPVAGAFDRGRNVLGLRGLLDGHRVVAPEPGEPACEERFEREVAAVLLADDDDERRPVHPRRGEPADRRPEPGRRVQQHQGRLAAADRIPAGHTDDGALVEAEHEAEIVRQTRQERHLRRARVREHRRQPPPPEDVERGVADGPGHRAGVYQGQVGRSRA